MKLRLYPFYGLLGAIGAASVVPAQAASIVTVRNSTVRTPAAEVASAEFSGVTNLTGSNFMLSAVMPATAQGGRASLITSQRWVRRYNAGAGSFQNAGYAIAVRADDSIVVAGPSQGQGDYDFVTLCYANNGTPLWTNRYDGPGHGYDTPRYVAVNAAGEVWVVGDSMRWPTNSEITDVAVLKYANNGTPVWTNRYTSALTNGDYPTGLAVDASGNAYVKLSSAYWQSSAMGSPVEDAIIKYDPQGKTIWEKHYRVSAPDSGEGPHGIGPMALDDSGNLFVGGNSGGGNFSTGISIVKFAGDGAALWTNHHSPGLMLGVGQLCVGRRGDLFATGESWTGTNEVYVLMKCSKQGVSLWTNFMPGPIYSGGNVPQTVLDLADNAILVGGGAGVTSPGRYQMLKMDSSGAPLWTNLAVEFGSANAMLGASAVDSSGNLYLAGYAPAPGKVSSDFVTLKYTNDGQLLWSNRFDGSPGLDNIAFAMAVDAAGDVYVTGMSEREPGSWDIATVEYGDLLSYAPARDFTGTDTIACEITDSLGNSTTQSVMVVVAPGSFQFNLSPAATRLTPGGMQLQVDGVPGTGAVVIEASVDQVVWQPILTNTPINGSVQFLDSAANSFGWRFYRAFQPQ